MAEALEISFDDWIRSLLNELQSNDDDMSDFVQYLMGIVTSDSETDEEKLTAITELLTDLDFKHDHPIETISQQILDRWNSSRETKDGKHLSSVHKNRVETDSVDDDVINNTLINAMNQMESTIKQRDSTANKNNEDTVSKRQKSQLLAKYSEVSDEELDYGDAEEPSRSEVLFHNTNSQEVEDRERRTREAQQEAHRKQQERHKLDAANQKQKDEDRKKKAQQRAQKQERRR